MRGFYKFLDEMLWILPMIIAPAIAIIVSLFFDSWQYKILCIVGLGAVLFVAFLYIGRMLHEVLETKEREEFDREIHEYFHGKE